MNRLLREKFVELYSKPILENVSLDFVGEKCSLNAVFSNITDIMPKCAWLSFFGAQLQD